MICMPVAHAVPAPPEPPAPPALDPPAPDPPVPPAPPGPVVSAAFESLPQPLTAMQAVTNPQSTMPNDVRNSFITACSALLPRHSFKTLVGAPDGVPLNAPRLTRRLHR